MNRNIIIGIIVLVAGLAVGWFVLQEAPGQGLPELTASPSPESEARPGSLDVPVETSPGASGLIDKGGVVQTAPVATSTVQYTDTGFTPNTVTVKAGTTVRFTNQSNSDMWVASAVHPTHQLLPGFDQLESLGKGGSYDYIFAKVGTWKYHNHGNATDTATVVVTQ
jgi:plastocyanin